MLLIHYAIVCLGVACDYVLTQNNLHQCDYGSTLVVFSEIFHQMSATLTRDHFWCCSWLLRPEAPRAIECCKWMQINYLLGKRPIPRERKE